MLIMFIALVVLIMLPFAVLRDLSIGVCVILRRDLSVATLLIAVTYSAGFIAAALVATSPAIAVFGFGCLIVLGCSCLYYVCTILDEAKQPSRRVERTCRFVFSVLQRYAVRVVQSGSLCWFGCRGKR